jgi:hypothetical protein
MSSKRKSCLLPLKLKIKVRIVVYQCGTIHSKKILQDRYLFVRGFIGIDEKQNTMFECVAKKMLK